MILMDQVSLPTSQNTLVPCVNRTSLMFCCFFSIKLEYGKRLLKFYFFIGIKPLFCECQLCIIYMVKGKGQQPKHFLHAVPEYVI